MDDVEKRSQETPIHVEAMSSKAGGVEIDPEKEKKLLRKIDLHLIPILSLLLLCAFVDRINIGNARIQGLEADLNMAGSDYNIALFTFFITYILFEVPCNMLLKKVRPSAFLRLIIGGCGIVTIGQGVTKSFEGLVVCRVLIGLLEAGFVPGCVYLISMFYKRHELQWRINLFYTASILAGAFSGLLAYAIAHMSGVGGYGGWRWIFILEGSATVFIAMFAYFYTPDWPQTAKFLTEEEREMLLARLAIDTPDASMNHWNKSTAKRVFGDVKIWLGALMYLGIVTTTYSTSFFTPTILRQLGWTALRAQVMSIPIYIAAAVVTLTGAVFSDRLRHRFGFILLGCALTTLGYGVLLAGAHVPAGACYMALYFVTCGCWLAQPITVVWLNNNLGGHYKRGIGAAIQLSIGNCSGFVASNIFISSQQPRYPLGFGVGLGFVWLCVFAACAFDMWIQRENKLRDAGKRDHRLDLFQGELDNLGDDHPSFRFTR
ncbi:transporter [Fusarium albosuccineum]|uniref:Transporter n=1 Tax=Fusarium albosuccineum TaxID=1237068 RepID=A0A8H4LP38_9HYPO|nr:transporter [Fusarium albosuccineum]